MVAPSLKDIIPGFGPQLWGSIFMITLTVFVGGGIQIVSKLGTRKPTSQPASSSKQQQAAQHPYQQQQQQQHRSAHAHRNRRVAARPLHFQNHLTTLLSVPTFTHKQASPFSSLSSPHSSSTT